MADDIMAQLNQLTDRVIGAAMAVHSALGPGLLESAYETCLAYELAERGLNVERQVALPVRYRGIQLDGGYRLDLLVENAVIVELKAGEALTDVHQAQMLSYLKLAEKRVGLLMNFNVMHLRQGIRRVILNR